MTIRKLALTGLLLPLFATAQTPRLWGMTPAGGANSQGTLFGVDADGTDFVKVFDFDEMSGWGPEGGLCLASNGKLYGTTGHGGVENPVAGTLFSFDPAGGGFHKILDFGIANGGGNWGSLIDGGDGLMYAAQYMGSGNGGSIYSVDPATDAYNLLYGLTTTTDGSGVTDKLLLGSDGLLYGTAHYGGANNSGTIFRFDPDGPTFEKLYDFTGGDGGDTPYGGLCEADDGWFYGTTFTGGAANHGVLYKYHPEGDQFVKLADMDTIPGSNCWSSMVSVGPDLLIGTVAIGGQYNMGFLYSITPSTDAFSQVYPFNAATGGSVLGNAIVGSDGFVYGLCGAGGTSGLGTAYKFDPGSHAMTVLHSFDYTNDGGTPRGDLVEAGTAVGIEDHAVGNGFQVRPNPTTGPITVSLSYPERGLASYAISDVLGRVLKTGTLNAGTNVLDIPGAPGGYVLTVTNADQRRSVRLMKN